MLVETVPRPRRWLQRRRDDLRLGLGLGLLGVICTGWTVIAVPLHYVLPKRWHRTLGRRATTGFTRFYLRALTAMGACRFELAELDGLRAEGPLILAPNHPCLLDALMVISRLPNVACIVKADIVDNVLFGAGARLAGYIRNDARLSMIKQSVAELKTGSHLLVFPEGTRTVRWPVNPCKGTPALIASRAKVPIQTLFIETDSAFLGKNWPLSRCPAFPVTYRIRLGRRFEPQDKAGVLTAALEHYFIAQLRDAPRFLPPEAPQAEERGAAQPL